MTERHIPNVTPPVINLNGTSKDALLRSHTAIIGYLRVANAAMLDAFPHGRDFQTVSRETYVTAASQAAKRIVAIEQIMMDFEALALAISNQE